MLTAALRQTPPLALLCDSAAYIGARSRCRSAGLVRASPMARGVSRRHRHGPPIAFLPLRVTCRASEPRRCRRGGWYGATYLTRPIQGHTFPSRGRVGTGIAREASQTPGGASLCHPHAPPSDDNALPSLPASLQHNQGGISVGLALVRRVSRFPSMFCCSPSKLTTSTHTTPHHHNNNPPTHKNCHGARQHHQQAPRHVSGTPQVSARPWR